MESNPSKFHLYYAGRGAGKQQGLSALLVKAPFPNKQKVLSMLETSGEIIRSILGALLVCCMAVFSAFGTEADALAISKNIRAWHMPFGTILDRVYSAPAGNKIVGYTRCGDSALWTGAYPFAAI